MRVTIRQDDRRIRVNAWQVLYENCFNNKRFFASLTPRQMRRVERFVGDADFMVSVPWDMFEHKGTLGFNEIRWWGGVR